MFCLMAALGYIFPWKPTIEYSREVLDSDGNLIHAFLTSDSKWRLKTDIEQADSLYLDMLLWKEDQYFYLHPGVNPLAIFRAAAQNILTGKRVSGASTISMQVVRLIKKRPRTFTSKLVEMWEALRLEGALSKQEILELYISLCPFGGNVEGYRSANNMYWNTAGKHISMAQCAALAIIPNQPERFHPVKKQERLLAARNTLLNNYLKNKQTFLLAETVSEHVDAQFYPMPKLATQLALRLAGKYPAETRMFSTINHALQTKVEKLSQDYVQKLKPYHIHNAAILVVENKTGKVRVYMGSQDFGNTEHAGQVDGIKAIRSPGSTLKPFLYAKMMQDGKLIPDQILYDVPMHFEGFAPENADNTFSGKVTATEALLNSLNIPAVYLLHHMGTDPFINLLEILGFESIQPQRHRIGMSLVLGGCGIKLEELVKAYSCLGNGGLLTETRLLENEKTNSKSRIFTEATTWLVGDMLAGWRRTFSSQTRKGTPLASQISWKTGTSFGKKDAWSVGYNQQYTVGVWLGNFDGAPSAAITGSDIATPLMLQVFQLFSSPVLAVKKPKNISTRKICRETGLPADTFCHETTIGFWLPETQLPICTHKILISVDTILKCMVCAECKSESQVYTNMWVENPEPVYRRFLKSKQIQAQDLPPHAAHCSAFGTMRPSRISSPVEGKTYIMDGQMFNGLPLEILSGAEVKNVFWYLDEKIVFQGSPEKLFSINPTSGKHKVSFVDDKGTTASVQFFVKQVIE